MHKQISPSYILMEDQLIGKGSTGNVYLGYLATNPKQQVAIKAIDIRVTHNEVTKYLLNCQIGALTTLEQNWLPGCEHIVKLLEVASNQHYVHLVTELLQGGTLAQYIAKNAQGLPQYQCLELLKQMLEGYLHVKSRNIIHRDIKPDNILFRGKQGEKKEVSIIDFGYCCMEAVRNSPKRVYNLGSPKYMSPEAFKDSRYSQKSDIWALGVTFFQMLIGKTCDQGMTMADFMDLVVKKGGVPVPDGLGTFVRHILQIMLCVDIEKRANCFGILKEIKNYRKLKTEESGKKSVKEIKRPIQNNNVVFKPVSGSQKYAKPPLPVKSSQKQIVEAANQPKVHSIIQKRQAAKPDRILISPKSIKMISNANMEPNRPAEKPSILSRAQNAKQGVGKKGEEGKEKTARIDLQIKQKKNFIEPSKPVDARSPSPNHKISFKFLSSSGGSQSSNEAKKQVIDSGLQSPRKGERVDSKVIKNDDSIRIQVQNASRNNIYLTREFDHSPQLFQRKFSNVSPVHHRTIRFETEKKISGEFTLEPANISCGQQVRRRDRIGPVVQIVSRDARTARQISLPKNVVQ